MIVVVILILFILGYAVGLTFPRRVNVGLSLGEAAGNNQEFPWEKYPETLELDHSKTYNVVIAGRVVMNEKTKARIVITRVLEMGADTQVSGSAYVFEALHIGTNARIGIFYSPPMIPIIGGLRYEEYEEDGGKNKEEEEERHSENDFKNVDSHVILTIENLVNSALNAVNYEI